MALIVRIFVYNPNQEIDRTYIVAFLSVYFLFIQAYKDIREVFVVVFALFGGQILRIYVKIQVFTRIIDLCIAL